MRLPAPTHYKDNDPTREKVIEDVWKMVFTYRCFTCAKLWSMAEDDDKPEFCPYCGKGSAA